MQRSNPLTSVDPRPSSAVRRTRSAVSTASLALVLALGGSALGRSGGLAVAHAQSNPQQLAESNKKAMEDYNNLDIERSKASLEKSAKNAEKAGIRGPALARTYSNLAVVLVGGLGDHKGAVAAFSRALKEDPKVEPDPIVATPEVMNAYNAAKANNAKGVPVPAEEDEEEEEAPVAKVAPSGPVEGNLDHTPAAEQLTQTAIPIFVKKSDDLDIDNIKVFYRSLGMKKPKAHELTETDDGYTYLIPCTDVFEPKVEYFLLASNSDGDPVGNSGTSEAPITVPVVAARTEAAPALPGQVAPSQCSSDDECPPGSPGCGGSAGMGDMCSSDNDCASGLVCDDDVCVGGEREAAEEEEEESSSSSSRGKKKWFVDANVGVGLVYVGSGKAADRSALPIFRDVEMAAREGGTLDLDRAERELQSRGFDCETSGNNNQFGVRNCKVAVNPGGFVPVPVLNLAVGYKVTPQLGVAVTGRFQIGSGEGPLAGIMLGARGEYALTKPADKGIELGVLAGLAVGQIQARPPAKGSRQGPYATNAKLGGLGFGLNVGAKVGYRINKSFAINVLPVMHFAIPNFLFALDLNAGAEVNF